jgi:leucyl aminopeptidase
LPTNPGGTVVQCAITESSLTQTEADAAVVALHRQDDRIRVRAEPDAVPDDVRQSLEHLFSAVGAGTGLGDTTVVPSPAPLQAGVVIGVGLGGPRPDLADAEVLRRAAGAAARAGRSFASLALALPAADQAQATAVLEGAILGGYSFDAFRTSSAKPTQTTSLTVLAAGIDSDAVAHTAQRAAAVNLCRDLVNTPPGDLRPSAFTDRVRAAAQAAGIEVSVIDADQLRSEASGGILAVGQGSADPPRLIRMSYRPQGASAHLALVGKGITFDSGGLSLKPPKSMETMKCDMSGAAAVASALIAVAAEGLPIAVTGWLAVAENMPSGTAQRPGDVIAMYGGTTVEVLNTDAEGRLVMGDALVRAARERPDALLDIATLTGAQMVALGMTTAGVMGNHAGLRDGICAVGREAGEALWPMPLPPDLRPTLDSPVADLANVGDRNNGGMLTAGIFLQEFVPDDVPWGHIDIAGPAFNTSGASGYTPKGGTGFGVRTLVAVARAMADGSLPL